MKIVCIGRNYRAHAAELKNEVPSDPVIFFKPETALVASGDLIKLPSFSKDVHHELELVLRVAMKVEMGATVPSTELYDQATVGLDLTARDVQSEMKKKGLPWEKAKAFDGSAVLGDLIPFPEIDPKNTNIVLMKNGETVQQGNTQDLIFPIATLAGHITRFTTLEPGDLIFTGTPVGVGPLTPGDELIGILNNTTLLRSSVAPN